MTQKNHEQRVRRLAIKLGYRIHKGRGAYHSNNQGRYQLVDDRNCVVYGDRYDTPLHIIEEFLLEQEKKRT